MKVNQTVSLYYNFDLRHQDPLDARMRIPTMADLPPLKKRYQGLIFHVVSENKPYIFLNDLSTPISLFDLITSSAIFGITSTDYSNLLDSLNATNPNLGSLVTVYPLNVTYIFNGTTWEYHSGTYNVTNSTQFNTIPAALRNTGSLVLVGAVRNVIKVDKTLSTEVIVLTELPTGSFDNNRYYSIDGNLYYAIAGVFYNIGSRNKVYEDLALVNGENTILHNLNSTYISLLFWINNTEKIIKLNEYNTVNKNSVSIESYADVTGTLLITTTF